MEAAALIDVAFVLVFKVVGGALRLFRTLVVNNSVAVVDAVTVSVSTDVLSVIA